MNWPGEEWSWLNNGHLDEIDEDLTVFVSGSGVISGEKQNQGDCSCDCTDTDSGMTANPTEMIAIHNDDEED
jgi:hypothetical protein